jgi:uncharacterized protein (TIGR02265 family)
MALPPRASSPDFAEPNWTAPLVAATYVAGVREGGIAKGMFFNCIINLAREKGEVPNTRPQYTAFKGYPLKEWIELLPRCAAIAYPHVPLRKALFETGAHVYRTFADSTVGRVVMSVAGRDVHAALRLVTRAYNSVSAAGSVTLAVLEGNRAVVEMRQMWEYPDCYQAGVLAAGVRAYGVNPITRVRSQSPCDVDIELSW